MDNEIIEEKRIWTKRWFWSTVIIAIGFILIITSNFDDVVNLGQAYADPLLCQNAIDKANKNEEVIQNFGKLESIDKLAILEGNTIYSNDNKRISITIRVSGEKEKGKMDILADRIGKIWKYKSIKIRNMKMNKEIEVNSQ
ncbi:cytochrome c oxidase assembly factor Coa1 family protein [Flavobacterium sp. 5]|uniref:cytochrome c oxidase assembly factor Coa1 family protein n=1 Tax=Flavobacterium sp. 5 TaxID=2035199 RepID=UPI000C2B581D|nr:cytochrome c oxidase assembly factor Coa1 family protein [Flavobacterium sp. 5]PKB15560.1 cytochrome oxidase complex assembly protein 1 [Flavobacterium sp. 5]